MKKLCVVLLILFVAGLFAGCGIVDTADQRCRRLVQITDLNTRMLVDDWDMFWFSDRSSNLTQWHPHVGY